MTRSIFDPTGDNTEHSGSTHLGPDASDISHMPPEAVDGRDDSDDTTPPPDAESDDRTNIDPAAPPGSTAP
jgi:hypothetical protein